MASTYHIDADKGAATIELTGFVTQPDFLDAVAQVSADPRWQPGFDCIWDGRGVGTFVLGIDELIEIAGTVARQGDRWGVGRNAVVASRELFFQVARLFCTLLRADGRTAEVFKSIEPARAWLGIEPPGLAQPPEPRPLSTFRVSPRHVVWHR